MSDGTAAAVEKSTNSAAQVEKIATDDRLYWGLSDQEKQIIEMLNIYD